MTTASADPVSVEPARRRSRWVGRAVAVVVGLIVAAGVCGGYWWAKVQTYHAFTISPGILYRDGNRDLREFRHELDRDQIRTVVSLVDDREVADPAKPQFRQEAEYCRDHGIRQVRIPVPLGGWPTSDQIREFLGIVADPANRPVLVHCAQGVRRTGMFMAAYQLSVLDRSIGWTQRTVQPFGHKESDLSDVRAFINGYDPATATVPPDLHGTGRGD